MPFSKCSNSEARNVINFHQRDKRSNYNFSKVKSRKRSFSDEFYASEIKIKEKFKLKTKLTEKKILKVNSMQLMQNLFSFQAPFKFLKSIH